MNPISREDLAVLVKEAAINPRIQRKLRFIPEEITGWEDRDFLAITNRSRSEGILVAPLDRLYVVPFQLQPRHANKAGRIEAIICDFCATWQRGSHSAIITFAKEKSTRSFLCCGDLLCSLHVRDKTSQSKISRTQLREQITSELRIVRLRKKLQSILAGERHVRGQGEAPGATARG